MQNFDRIIKTYSPWMKFDDIDWSPYLDKMMYKKYKSNQTIYYQGECADYVYLIKEGRVRLSTFSIDGREQALTIVEDGSLFGELSIIDGEANFATATAVIDSSIYLIEKTYFKALLEKDPNINNLLIKNIVRKTRVLSSLVESLSFHKAEARVAKYLLELVNTHSHIQNELPILNVKFTQQELADLTGLSRVSVSQVMNIFYEQNIILKKNGYIIFKDANYLRSIT